MAAFPPKEPPHKFNPGRERPREEVVGGMAEPDPPPPPSLNRKQRRAAEKIAKLRRNAFVKAAKRRIRKNEALLEKLAKVENS